MKISWFETRTIQSWGFRRYRESFFQSWSSRQEQESRIRENENSCWVLPPSLCRCLDRLIFPIRRQTRRSFILILATPFPSFEQNNWARPKSLRWGRKVLEGPKSLGMGRGQRISEKSSCNPPPLFSTRCKLHKKHSREKTDTNYVGTRIEFNYVT